MARFWAGLTTSAGSTTLPICALVGGATAFIRIYEIKLFNTSTTAVGLIMCRLSTAGTPGTAAISRLPASSEVATPVGVLRNTYTSVAPTTTELGERIVLGAAAGSGLILPYADEELTIGATANAGIGFITDSTVNSGTGQAVQVTFKWRE